MEKSVQPDLDLKTPPKEEIKISPLAQVRAKILALRKGIPYSQAIQELLEEEVGDRQQERKEQRAP